MNWPAYPEYKDSGVDALGEIPASWTVGALKRWIASVESGTSVNAADIAAGPGEVGVLKTSCVYTGEFDIDENKTVVIEELDRVTCQVKTGSLIVSRMNTPDLVGSAGYVKDSRPGIFLPDRLWQVTFQDLSAKWVGYWSKTQTYRDQIRLTSVGASSSMHNISQPDYGSFVLAVPPPYDQEAIADFLDRETAKSDALIDKQNQLIATLREDRTATITHAVTRGVNPDVEMKDSGVAWLGSIPAHWSAPQVGMHTSVGNGATPARENAGYWANGTVPWLNSSHVNRAEITDADQFVTDRARSECHLPLVPAGSVLVGLTGQGKTRGMASILQTQATINQHLAYLTPANRTLDAGFLHRVMVSAYQVLRDLSDENGSTKGGLTCAALRKLRIPVPPVDEQLQIVAHLRAATAQIDALTAKAAEVIDRLREYRSALITAAVTGKIDVREAA